MQTIQIPEVSFPVPVVGFGCTGLMGPSTDRERRRFLEVAFEEGIRHFDVARYYGYGEAERIVAQFARGRRDQISITTKFGIEPPARVGPMRLAANVARKVVRLLPFTRKAVAKQAAKLVKFNVFTADAARRNLETSLRELGTDHVDFFLIHGYRAAEPASDELLAFLEGARTAGKVRAFGVATEVESAVQLAGSAHPLARVIQLENNLLHPNLERLPAASSSLVIAHRPLANAYHTLRERLTASAPLCRRWSDELGCDLSSSQVLAELLLCWAVSANPRGLVLFQSRSLERIRANVGAVRAGRYSPAQLATLERLASGTTSPTSCGRTLPAP